jgi:hypothetical protein
VSFFCAQMQMGNANNEVTNIFFKRIEFLGLSIFLYRMF